MLNHWPGLWRDPCWLGFKIIWNDFRSDQKAASSSFNLKVLRNLTPYWSVSLTKSERKWKHLRLSDFQYLSYSRQLTINFASDLDAIFYQLKVPLFPLVVAINTCTMWLCTPIDAKTWKRKDLIGRSSNSDYQEIYLIQTILVFVSSQWELTSTTHW